MAKSHCFRGEKPRCRGAPWRGMEGRPARLRLRGALCELAGPPRLAGPAPRLQPVSQAGLPPADAALCCFEVSLWHPWNVRLPGSAVLSREREGRGIKSLFMLAGLPSGASHCGALKVVNVSGTTCEWPGAAPRGGRGGPGWVQPPAGPGACSCPVLGASH